MKKKLTIVFSLLVCIPLVAVIWFGARAVRAEQNRVADQFIGILVGRLRDLGTRLDQSMHAVARDLEQAVATLPSDADGLRGFTRHHRLVKQVFIMRDDRTLLYPQRGSPRLTDRERSFLDRTRSVWDSGELFYHGTEGRPTPREGETGWHTWFWGPGLHIIFWVRRADGNIIGFELDRAMIMSEAIAVLPSTESRPARAGADRIALRDAKNRVLYAWGDFEPGPEAEPAAVLPAPPPLDSWQLAYFVSPTSRPHMRGWVAAMGMSLLVAGILVIMLGLALYFYRESSREVREAGQRVSFVNQVSHELKTPLTNIRMYAELLAALLDADDTRARHHAEVIIDESRRLGRLIANVLTFAKGQRQQLRLRPQPGVVDETVASVADSFRPVLTACGVVTRLELNAPAVVHMDQDAVEQILGNLLSNVEKYGTAGKTVDIRTRQDHQTTTIRVRDRGPGIPMTQRERIFRPFTRVSNRLTDGVSGTGIGLSIVRELARKHGGEAELEPVDHGACFRVTLATPPVSPDRSYQKEPTDEDSRGRRRPAYP